MHKIVNTIDGGVGFVEVEESDFEEYKYYSRGSIVDRLFKLIKNSADNDLAIYYQLLVQNEFQIQGDLVLEPCGRTQSGQSLFRTANENE
jgi:hypothetical protein